MSRTRGNRHRRLCLFTAAALAAFTVGRPAPAASPEQPVAAALIQQPRAFGYVLGDLITQRVLLQLAGAPFQLAKTPPTQRVGLWLERRVARIESAADGRHWLVLEYQLINAPRSLTTINMPPLLLKSAQGSATLIVPDWPVSVSPLTPHSAFEANGLGALRPDRQAAVIASEPIRRQVYLWFTALAATVVAWVAWTKGRNRMAALNQPFARAWHEIQQLDAANPQAWQTLHRAFDRTAGRVMHADTLPVLFERAPHLQPLRAQIEAFFAASSERFFGTETQSSPASLHSLSDVLKRVERRNER